MNIKKLVREAFQNIFEEEYFSEKLSDEIKENSAEYVGRSVTWYGDPNQMIVINKSQIEGMWGNIYDSEKMKFLTNLIKNSEENVEIECSYGIGDIVNFQEIKEHQISKNEGSFDTDYDGIDEPYSIGDEELDDYIGNETYIPDENMTSITEVDDFFIENKFKIAENIKSVEELKKEFYNLERDEDGEDFKEESDYEAFNEYVRIEQEIKDAIKNKEGDIGLFTVQIRDGHHRIMSAIAAGEDKVCLNLTKEGIKKFKGHYQKVDNSSVNENVDKNTFYKENKINDEELSYLGSGDFGEAYSIGDGRVLKITSSKSEFDIAKKLINKDIPVLEGFAKFYFADIVDGKYYIIMEELEEDSEIENLFYELQDILENEGLPIQYLSHLDLDDYEISDELKKFIDDIEDINRGYRYLGIQASDIHSENLGYDNNGKLKAFDIEDKSINEESEVVSEIRKIVKKCIKEVFSEKKTNLLSESSDPFAASGTRKPFDIDLMSQAIQQGREVGLLYKGDDMKAPSGKYRLIYPVAMGVSKAGNRVIRAIHKIGQSESKAQETGVRSAEAKNEWRLFKTDNIKGMWFTGNFFDYVPSNYNSNDKGMNGIEVTFNSNEAKQFQEEFIRNQKAEERKAKITRFKEKSERDIEQPYANPETRIGSNQEDVPPIPNDEEELD
jgi:hypothetical protein